MRTFDDKQLQESAYRAERSIPDHFDVVGFGERHKQAIVTAILALLFLSCGIAAVLLISEAIRDRVSLITPVHGAEVSREISGSKSPIPPPTPRRKEPVYKVSGKRDKDYFKRYIYGIKKFNGRTVSVYQKKWLIATMICESGGREKVVNSYGYTGLMQFHPGDWKKRWPKDNIWSGERQIVRTLQKYYEGGQRMWAASESCRQDKLNRWWK